mmetsp:Transcript_31422/g.100140  ORF Transcript_31422/g.100140 Transcript_31422/m.100140 type:complete len:109 (+) Transcript_31422:196-522(+)
MYYARHAGAHVHTWLADQQTCTCRQAQAFGRLGATRSAAQRLRSRAPLTPPPQHRHAPRTPPHHHAPHRTHHAPRTRTEHGASPPPHHALPLAEGERGTEGLTGSPTT